MFCMKMSKILIYCLLVCAINIYSVYSSDDLIDKFHKFDVDDIDMIDYSLAMILGKCEFMKKNMVIYNDRNVSRNFNFLSALKPQRAVTLLSRNTKHGTAPINLTPTQENLGIQLLILIINEKSNWIQLIDNIKTHWILNKNCTIFIIPYLTERTGKQCSESPPQVGITLTSYIFTTYYFCIGDGNVGLRTYDPYGNTNPLFWEKLTNYYRGNILTTYVRTFQEDNICQGFFFKRSNPYNKYIVIGHQIESLKYSSSEIPEFETDVIFDSSIEESLRPRISKILNYMKKLMKVKFVHVFTDKYASVPYQYNNGQCPDILMYYTINGCCPVWIQYPINYDDYIIWSNSRGFATPFEKITEFYGYVTLISIIIISLMSLIAIWIEKNIYLAIFDVLRLWTNTEIFVPMPTNSIRIFFFFIFLYFLIIHATFTGNLAKFMTKPQLRRNIDTIKDLTDSRIEKIFNFEYDYGDIKIEDKKKLLEKTKKMTRGNECIALVKNHSKSVCITTKNSIITSAYKHTDFDNYYVSKGLMPTSLGLAYRRRMPWEERFNWFILTLRETRVLTRDEDVGIMKIYSEIDARKQQAEYTFRPISLKDLTFVFILLSVGLTVSTVCFFTELLIARIRKNKRTKMNKPKVMKIHVRPK